MDVYFDEIRQDLSKGASQKGHPFQYFTLGTVGLEHLVRQRTVVLRRFEEDLSLTFYTDVRSKKIMHLNENNRVGLLFFDPEKLLQVRIEGLAKIHKDQETIEEYLSKVHTKSLKDYTTVEAPGSLLEDPDQVEYLNEENHFCMVRVQPFKIEYLKLQEPHHLRIRYSKVEDLWKSEFLVP